MHLTTTQNNTIHRIWTRKQLSYILSLITHAHCLHSVFTHLLKYYTLQNYLFSYKFYYTVLSE